jgi:hypothetical protein
MQTRKTKKQQKNNAYSDPNKKEIRHDETMMILHMKYLQPARL